MKAQSPLLGFNNNVRHKGRVFHIQTEDSGVKHPHVITHLFADGGRIVRSQKTSYAEYVGDDELQRKVRALMQEQHKAMFIALRAGKFDHLIEGVPVAEAPPAKGGRAPMESTVSIEIGNESDPGGVVHVAPGEAAPRRPTPAATAAASGAASSSNAGAGEVKPAPKEAKANALPPPAPAAEVAEPPSTDRSPPPASVRATAAGAPPPAAADGAAAGGLRKLTPLPPQPQRPASIIPPAAKPLTAPSVPPPPAASAPIDPLRAQSEALRNAPRRNSGLLAALGALSSGTKAPSLGASPPSSARAPTGAGRSPAGSAPGAPPGRPPMRSSNDGGGRALPENPATAPTHPRMPAPSSLDLDLEALERAAEQGNSPVYRQVRDFPPPPQAVRSTGNPAMRSLTPSASPASIPQPPPSQPSSQGGRYAPSRPASIFGNAKPQEGSSIFGEDLISEKSLDEVILSYLAEDLDVPPKKTK